MPKPEYAAKRHWSAGSLNRKTNWSHVFCLVVILVVTVLTLARPSSAQQLPQSVGTCPGLLGFENSGKDASDVLQRCIDDADPGTRLQFQAGAIYTLGKPVSVHKPLELATAGVGKNRPACDSAGGPVCARFFLDPTTPYEEGAKETGAVFEVSSDQVTIRHLVIDGMGNLSAGFRKSCNPRALIRISGSTSSIISKVVIKNNACGDALDIRKSKLITIRDSSFTENGSSLSRSSGIRVSGSQEVNIVNNFFFDNSKFAVHVLSCQDCQVDRNVAWHSAKLSKRAIGAFRVVGGDVSISDNLSDCGGTGCVADFIVGSVKHQPGKAESEIRLFGNVSLNPQTGFIFGRDAVVQLVDNFAVGGERECAEKEYFGFTKMPGARVVINGSRLRAHHIEETETSLTPIMPEDIERCTMRQTSRRKLPKPDGDEPSIQNAIQSIFRRELSRPARQSEKKRFGKMLAGQKLDVSGLIARARGLDTLSPAKISEIGQDILPQRCSLQLLQGKEEEVCIQQLGEDGIIGGDVRVPGLFGPALAGSISAKGLFYKNTKIWPNGIVPYAISSSVPPVVRTQIINAINTYNSLTSRTHVRFVPRTNEQRYIDFVYVELSPFTCGDSTLGMAVTGQRQEIRINKKLPHCSYTLATLLHEIGHALGLDHEHTRPDRDNFIKINFQNYYTASSDFSINKKSADSSKILSPYDISSIMHYSSFSGSKNGMAVFVNKNKAQIIPVATALSNSDINSIAKLYEPKKPDISIRQSFGSASTFEVQYTSGTGISEIKYSVLEADSEFSPSTLGALSWPTETSFRGYGSPAYFPEQAFLPITSTPGHRCIAVRARAIQQTGSSAYSYGTFCGPLTSPGLSITQSSESPSSRNVQYQIAPGITEIKYSVLEADSEFTPGTLGGLSWPAETSFIGTGSPAFLYRQGALPITPTPQYRCIAVRVRARQGTQFSDYSYGTHCSPPPDPPILQLNKTGEFDVQYQIPQGISQIEFAVLAPVPPAGGSARKGMPRLPLEVLSRLQWPSNTLLDSSGSQSVMPTIGSIPLNLPSRAQCIALRARTMRGSQFSEYRYQAFCDPKKNEPDPILPVVDSAHIRITSDTLGLIDYDITPGSPYVTIVYAVLRGPEKFKNLEAALWPVEQVFIPQNSISLQESGSFPVNTGGDRCVGVKLRAVYGTRTSKTTYITACRD